jgi:hypothetical protein
MLRSILPALALALAAGPALAAADDAAAAKRDVRCILVIGLIASNTQAAASESAKQGMIAGMGYYLGRLKGREPDIDLTARIVAETRGIRLADIQGEALRCGDELKAFGAESQRVGAALKAVGEEARKTATD